MILRRANRSTRIKTCHSATVPVTSRTLTDLGSSLGLRVEKIATSRLRDKSPQFVYIYIYIYICVCVCVCVCVRACFQSLLYLLRGHRKGQSVSAV